MTLFLACLLIHAFGFHWSLYLLAAVLWCISGLASFLLRGVLAALVNGESEIRDPTSEIPPPGESAHGR